MDLFIKAANREQWIKKLKSNIKKWGKDNAYEVPKRFALAVRNTEKIEGTPLFILPPFKGSKMYDTFHDNTLRNICTHYGIIDYSMTYCFPFPKDPVTVHDIKDFSVKVYELIQLLSPSLIIILGEPAQHSLLSRKHPLDTWHGMIVPNCEFKTMLMYPAEYYCRRTKNEDKSFKAALREQDWSNLKNELSPSH